MGVPRQIKQIAAATSEDGDGTEYAIVFALAADGTLWRAAEEGAWRSMTPLPDAEACGARFKDERASCRLVAGHQEDHWSGERRWR